MRKAIKMDKRFNYSLITTVSEHVGSIKSIVKDLHVTPSGLIIKIEKAIRIHIYYPAYLLIEAKKNRAYFLKYKMEIEKALYTNIYTRNVSLVSEFRGGRRNLLML